MDEIYHHPYHTLEEARRHMLGGDIEFTHKGEVIRVKIRKCVIKDDVLTITPYWAARQVDVGWRYCRWTQDLVFELCPNGRRLQITDRGLGGITFTYKGNQYVIILAHRNPLQREQVRQGES